MVEEEHEADRSGSIVVSELNMKSDYENRPSESIKRRENNKQKNTNMPNIIMEEKNKISTDEDDDRILEVDEKVAFCETYTQKL